MAATPTNAEIKKIRPDVEEFLSNDLTLQDYAERALAYVQRDVEDIRGIVWSKLYNSAPLVDDYLSARNRDRLIHAISLRAVALVFHDYAISASDGGQWWELGNAYRSDYEQQLDRMKLDIDENEDGTISECEELAPPKRFWRQ